MAWTITQEICQAKRESLRSFEKSADILDQTTETNKSVEINIAETEPTPLNLERSGSALPSDDAGKQIPEVNLSHSAAVHLNQADTANFMLILHTGKSNRSKSVRISKPMKITTGQTAFHKPTKRSSSFKKAAHPNKFSQCL